MSETHWRLIFRLVLFSCIAVAAFDLFWPEQKEVVNWMRGRVAEVKDCRTFGFQPDGKDFWYTARVEGNCERGLGLELGQAVEVYPLAFEKDGVMRARISRPESKGSRLEIVLNSLINFSRW